MIESDLTTEQLALIRKTFFAKATEKSWFQERNLLLQAIAFPAAHLKERYGVNTPVSLSRSILRTVIETIKAHGNRAKIGRVSVYFLHCVQQNMLHHGEEYYEAAKAALRAAESLPEIMSKVRLGEAARSTDVLVQLHRTLKSRGGRKKKSAEAQLSLI